MVIRRVGAPRAVAIGAADATLRNWRRDVITAGQYKPGHRLAEASPDIHRRALLAVSLLGVVLDGVVVKHIASISGYVVTETLIAIM